ncbi:MAG: ABC transporter ATP-binding protein [Treponema sp.]|jgi:iron complex transport system ATP-binding protein|nr:ABC transporter ATP-binding protein [Treponema sp.]
MVNQAPVLEARDLSFSYGSREILHNINFVLERGELLGLLGANGSGKSTLFRCVLGLDKYHTGSVFLERDDIKNKTPAAIAGIIAYVPQAHQPSFNYSVLDMILMGAAAREKAWALPGDKQKNAAENAMEQLGITRLRARGFRQLSGGEQQLVLIARALAQEASILVMDEPTANLDYGNQLHVLFEIKKLSRRGYSIFLSTHNPDHAFLFADRILALHNRKIIASGTAGEVLTPDLIQMLYGIQVRLRKDERGILSSAPVMSNFTY